MNFEGNRSGAVGQTFELTAPKYSVESTIDVVTDSGVEVSLRTQKSLLKLHESDLKSGTFVAMSLGDLGLSDGVFLMEVLAAARARNLQPVPRGTALLYAKKVLPEVVHNEKRIFVSQFEKDDEGYPMYYYTQMYEGHRALSLHSASPTTTWHSNDSFVFVVAS